VSDHFIIDRINRAQVHASLILPARDFVENIGFSNFADIEGF